MNLTIIKLLLLAVTAPLWWPFVRALWEEFNEALAEDGGLFGKAPTRREAGEIRAERRDEAPLVHEPWVRPGEHRRGSFPAGRRLSTGAQPEPGGRAATGGGGRGGGKPRASGRGPGGARPRGFR